MRKKTTFILLAAFLVFPALAIADASVVQLWCEEVTPDADFVRIHFSVVNFSLPAPVCDLHLLAEPFPPVPECEPLACGSPDGWDCNLNALGGADWFASGPESCIAVGDMYGEYTIDLPAPDAGFCCFVVQFTGPAGEVLLEQEECFYCTVVPLEETTWGTIKSMYR